MAFPTFKVQRRHHRVIWTGLAVLILTCGPIASFPAGGTPIAERALPQQVQASAPAVIHQEVAAADEVPIALPPPAPIRKAEALTERVTTPETPSGSQSANQSAPASGGSNALGYGCDAALAYLRANAAPGFTFQCPGYSYGNQAMTCVNHAPQCPGQRLITITVPCAAAYQNEANNSWILIGARSGRIDPYGYCH
jgi:hypothetical protein